MRRPFAYLLILMLSAFSVRAQKITTHIDTTRNKIGAQFNLTLKATTDTASVVQFPFQKTVGNLEVIRNYRIDTVKNGGTYDLIRKYGLTQFDSGTYVIPPLKILVNGKAFFSDSLKVEVSGIKVDTLNQKMYEIKPIAPVQAPMGNWWKYALGLVLIGGIGFALYYLLKYRQKQRLEEEIYKTPIEKATSLLSKLEKKELWQKGEVKSYYSELTDIARIYIEEEIDLPAMESTTSEVIAGLRLVAQKKQMKLSGETLENLEKVLKQADLVKFAKSLPLDFEIQEDKKRIEKTIVQIHKSIPEEATVQQDGDSVLNELLKEKMLKKRKKRRVVLAAAAVLMLLFISTSVLVAIKGRDFLRETLLGYPTKELAEGDWITSAYGSPQIQIESPKILTRIDAKQFMPKEAMAMIQEMNMFTYGKPFDTFSMILATTNYKQGVEIKLEDAINGAVKTLEARGARNILTTKEDFTTADGIAGLKGSGTYDTVDPSGKKNIKVQYEIYVFNQKGGVQMMIIGFENGDKYGLEIAERITKSITFVKDEPLP